MYSEKVMDHFTNPRNMGEIEDPSGVGTVGNAKCGDIMRIYLDIDENKVIRECKFKTFGCGAAVATSSMATELPRKTALRSKGSVNPNPISTRMRKGKRKNTDEGKSSGRHVRGSGFCRGSLPFERTRL